MIINADLAPFYQHEYVDLAYRRLFRMIEHDDRIVRESWATCPMTEGPLTLAALFDEDHEVYRHIVEVRRPELDLYMLDHDAINRRLWSDLAPDHPTHVEPVPTKHYRLRTGSAQAAVSVMELFQVGAYDLLPAYTETIAEFDHVILRAVRYWLDDPE